MVLNNSQKMNENYIHLNCFDAFYFNLIEYYIEKQKKKKKRLFQI